MTGYAHFSATQASDPQTPVTAPGHEMDVLRLCIVVGKAQSRLWNEYVARFHSQDYTPLSGAQMRCKLFAGGQWVAWRGTGLPNGYVNFAKIASQPACTLRKQLYK